MNNVVLMFSPTDEMNLTSRDRIVRSYRSVGSRVIDSPWIT